jgi:hypothetical protein
MRIRLSELRKLVREALAGSLGAAVIIAGMYRGKSAGPRGYTRYKPFKYSNSGNSHPIVYAKTFPTAEEAATAAKEAHAVMRSIMSKMNRSGYLKSYSIVTWDFDKDASIRWGQSDNSGYLYDSTHASNKLFQQWGIMPRPGAAPAPAPASPAAAAPEPSTSGSPPPEQTYRIYGKRGASTASTRVKGKVYVAPPGTRFRAGQQASVSRLGDKLQVRDVDTNDKQVWDPE